MTRRIAFTAAAAIIGIGLVAPMAHALTARTAKCVRDARAGLRDCTATARDACRTDYTTAVNVCFAGPGLGCATSCQDDLLSCQAGPIGAQTACRNDGIPGGTDCTDVFEGKRDVCRAITNPVPEEETRLRRECLGKASLERFACNQACGLASRDELQACNTTFNDCLESCANPQ
jgi:hypothetical protein